MSCSVKKQHPIEAYALSGQTALVTAASAGIGAAVAEALAEAGVTVAAHGAELCKDHAQSGERLAAYKVRVNAIVPGVIKTSCERWIDPQQEARLLERIPYGRLGEPQDIAHAVLWLASDALDYVTGETVYVNGWIRLQSGAAD